MDSIGVLTVETLTCWVIGNIRLVQDRQTDWMAYWGVMYRNAASCVWFGLTIMVWSSQYMREITQTPCKKDVHSNDKIS